MLSVSGSPYSIPAIRAAGAVRQGRPVHFGATPETPDASEPDETNAPSDTTQTPAAAEPGIIDSIKNWFKEFTESGLIQGPWKAVNVLWKFPAWDSVLEKANKDVKARERALAIFDIAFASFREAFAPQAQDAAKATTHRLYTGVLKRFPMLVFEQKLPQDLNLVEKTIETSPDPENLRLTAQGWKEVFSSLNKETDKADDYKFQLDVLLERISKTFSQ